MPFCRLGPLTGSPSISTRPRVAVSRPPTMRMSVVLPQPDGPRKTTNSPLIDGDGDVVDDGDRRRARIGLERLADALDGDEEGRARIGISAGRRTSGGAASGSPDR